MIDNPASSGEQFLSADHWVGALNSESKDFLTAIEAYRGEPSTANLIPSLRRFAGMGDILYFRRPSGVTEEKFNELGQHYNSAAEILTGFLLPSADDQRELGIKEKYGSEDWSKRLQEHFAAATQVDEKLGDAEIAESDRGRLVSLGAARLIRLGQMIFFRMPEEFLPQSQQFQAFFMEAMNRYLGRLDGLAAGEDLDAGRQREEAIDYSKVELGLEVEELWRQIDEKSGQYLLNMDIQRFLTGIKEVSPSLSQVEKEALLYRFFQKDGWMSKRFKKAFEDKTQIQTIEVPALFEALGADQPIGDDLVELLAEYSCGRGGVLDLSSRDIINEYHTERHFPPAGVRGFPEFAYREYKAALAAALSEEGAAKLADGLWLDFSRLKDSLPGEYLEPLQRAARESCPQMLAVIFEQTSYYKAWRIVDHFANKDYFGEYSREEFDQAFAALARNKFGFSLLGQPETTGREEKEFQGPLDLITSGNKYSRGAFDKELFGKYLTESQRMQFFEAVCEEESLWPEGERVSKDVLRAIQDMNFYDQVRYEKLMPDYRFQPWMRLNGLMPTREALQREIARRRALVERELMINLAMTGELPVHNPTVDELVDSGEADEAVERARRLAREMVKEWSKEGRRETLAPEIVKETREALFFGRDRLAGIFSREFSGWCQREGLPLGQTSAWGERTADKFLTAGTTAESRKALMEEINFIKGKGVGNLEKLVIKEKTAKRGEETPREFMFTEPRSYDPVADGSFLIDADTGGELLAELRQIAEAIGEVGAGPMTARIYERLDGFTKSKLAEHLGTALGSGGKDELSRTKQILGLLSNQEMEAVREAIRDMAMLKMFADGNSGFGEGKIELTDGNYRFEGIYPPLLVADSKEEVLPYSVPPGVGLTVVVGPNGGGKTMLISAMAANEAMVLTGMPPLASEVGIPKNADGVPLMQIGSGTATQVSRFDNSVREAVKIDQGLSGAASVTMDEAFAGTGDSYRGHLQAALALKALAQGRPVRLTTHQTETFYQDMAALGTVDGLESLGLAGQTQWLAVDAYHRVVPGRISPFGIEMAAGAGFPTAVAENAKRLRDVFTGGTAVKMEAIKPRLEEEKRMPEWASRETLLRLGINGMWDTGYWNYSKLPEGEGDVLGYFFREFKNVYPDAGWGEELWFRRTMTRFIQRQESEQDWQQRAETLKQYVGDKAGLRREMYDYRGYENLLNNFMIVDSRGELRDKKLDAEEIFYLTEADKTMWQREYEADLDWRNLPMTLRRVRQGREMILAKEAAALGESLKTVGRVSGMGEKVESSLRRLAEEMGAARKEQKAKAAAVLTKAISAQAAAAVGGFWGDVSKKPGYGGLRQELEAAGWEGGDRHYLTGSDLKYFLKREWNRENYLLPIKVLRHFGEGGLIEDKKDIDWHKLFDGSWKEELKQFPIGKTRGLDAEATVEDLGKGNCGRLVELFDWMDGKDLSEEVMKRYRQQFPLMMGLFNLYQRTMDADFVQRWQDKLWGDAAKEREEAVGALERANVNLVLAAGLRQPEKTHLVFTEVGEGEEVELEEAYNPGTLQAGIDEVPQTVNWTSGQAMVVSGPNTGGKTSLAKKIMVKAALHKAMGVGVGKRIRLPKAEMIGGLYASINAAETRVGEGNLASEARDVGKFLGDYLTAGCPQGVWFFGDELFTGTGQADQAGLLGAAVQAVTQSGGRCIVTTNEEGIIRSLDQAGVSHQDIRFSYRDPETQFAPMPGVGGPESFQVARDLGLDSRVVDLAEELSKAQRELEKIKLQRAGLLSI